VGATGATGATGPAGTTGQNALAAVGTGYLQLAANPGVNNFAQVPGMQVTFTVPASSAVLLSYSVGAYVYSSSSGGGSGAEVALFSDSTCTTNIGGTLALHGINDNGQGYMTALGSTTLVFATPAAGTYSYYLCARRSYIPGTNTLFGGTTFGMIVSSDGTRTTGGAGPWQYPGVQARMSVEILKK
jgi:hypothetical protein